MTFDDLKFIRINSPKMFNLIPRYLFEQVRDREFDIDRLYEASHVFLKSPCTVFHVLIDKDNFIKGFLWATVNILTESINVDILSVDNGYQFENALEKTLEFVRSWSKKAKKIKCITTRPKAYERVGWKRSKKVILEI